MSDLAMEGEDGLEAGLAAGFGAPHIPVLAALEGSAGTLLPRVTLRDPGHDGPLTRSNPALASLTPSGRAHYQLHGEIARGGMGVVLKGRDVDLGREVALKVLRDDCAATPEIVQRFVEEAQISGQLQHPGIVPVYELGLLADQRPYFAMKLVHGRTLSAALAERAVRERGALTEVFASICQTMAYAHSRGVVHRDLKPANVLLGAFGEVQVIDWGLAKVLSIGGVADEERLRRSRKAHVPPVETVRLASTPGGKHSAAGSVMGTPAYMSPEQARGEIERIDERSDVFALGAILCEILTGNPPYRGEGESALAQAARADVADARRRLETCEADPALVELCEQCLAPRQSERPRSAEVLAERMQTFLASLEERARRAELRTVEERMRARSTIQFASFAAAVVLAGAVVALVWREDRVQRVLESERAVGSALAEATLARGGGDWPGARAALERARAWLESVPNDALREQVASFGQAIDLEAQAVRAREELARDNALWLAELENVRQPEGDSVYPTDWATLQGAYSTLFNVRAVRIDEQAAAATADLLAGRGVSVELAGALDGWTGVRRSAGDEAGALRLMRVADALDPDPLRSELREAQSRQDMAALQVIAERARTEPLPGPTLRLLAHGLVSASQLESAIELLRAGCRRNPGDYGLALELGRALRRCKPPRANEALAHHQAAVALRPNNVEAWHELGMTLNPLLKRPDLALDLFREAVERFPGDGHLHFHLGTALVELGRDSEAVPSLHLALASEPNFTHAYTNLGTALDRLGRFQEAIECYERGLAVDPNATNLHHNLGISLRNVGRIEEAIEQFERALELDSGFARSHVELAYIHLTRDAFADALVHAQRSIELDPTFAYSYFSLGRALEGTGRTVEARDAFAQCVRLTPDFVPAQQALARLAGE